MSASLSSKKSLLLWVCIGLCLLPFVVLSFFNWMAYDDYLALNAFKERGFWDVQRQIYLYWEGRFTATFLCAVFVKSGILSHYYNMVFFLFAFASWGAILFLLNSINTCCLRRSFYRSSVVQASLVLFIMDLYVKVELSSGSYWFSPTAVYQTGVILFLALAGCMVRRFGGRPRGMNAAIIFLSILICGSNEVAAISLACCFGLLILAFRFYRRPIPTVLFLYPAVVLLSGVIILLTSGVLSQRQAVMKGHAGYATTILILFYRTLSIFYYVLKDPLFWVCAGCCFILGLRISSLVGSSPFIVSLKSRRFFIPGLAALVLIVLLTLAPILLITFGSIPERALNGLSSLAAFGMLTLVFLTGTCRPDLAGSILAVKKLSTLLVFFTACALLANYNYKEAWKSVITGYFYHAIQSDRQKVFLAAYERHLPTVTITSYTSALDEKIGQLFPHGAPVTLQRWLQERPSVLYYDNEAENPSQAYLRRYYQLDSILVRESPK